MTALANLNDIAAATWNTLLANVWREMQHGSVRDEWFALGVLADWLDDQDDRPISYYVPYTGRGNRTESCREAATRLRVMLSLDQQQTAESNGRRGNWGRIAVTIAHGEPMRADGLLLPGRRYSM